MKLFSVSLMIQSGRLGSGVHKFFMCLSQFVSWVRTVLEGRVVDLKLFRLELALEITCRRRMNVYPLLNPLLADIRDRPKGVSRVSTETELRNDMKPTLTPYLATAGLAMVLATNASAALIVGAAPTTNVIHNSIAGGINSNMLDEDVNSNHGRADSFTLGTSPSGTFDITSVTLAKNGNQTFEAGDTMTVFIATGGATEWANGTGHNTADDGTNYLVDTGMVLQVQEVFSLVGLITGADFVTFEFASPVTVDDDTEYTVGWVFEEGSSTATGPDRFGYDENTNGGRLSIVDGAYGGASSRGISFSVQGVPEPSVALLGGLGLFGLLRRRRD